MRPRFGSKSANQAFVEQMRMSQSRRTLEAAADGEAVDRGDVWLLRQRVGCGLAEAHGGLGLTGGELVVALLEVGARAEGAPRARHDAGAHLRVRLEVSDGALEILLHRAAEGVEPLGPVHREDGEVVTLLVQQIGHGESCLCSAAIMTTPAPLRNPWRGSAAYAPSGQPPCVSIISSMRCIARGVSARAAQTRPYQAMSSNESVRSLAVLQPLLGGPVAADGERPCLRRDALEVLLTVDPDAARRLA